MYFYYFKCITIMNIFKILTAGTIPGLFRQKNFGPAEKQTSNS